MRSSPVVAVGGLLFVKWWIHVYMQIKTLGMHAHCSHLRAPVRRRFWLSIWGWLQGHRYPHRFLRVEWKTKLLEEANQATTRLNKSEIILDDRRPFLPMKSITKLWLWVITLGQKYGDWVWWVSQPEFWCSVVIRRWLSSFLLAAARLGKYLADQHVLLSDVKALNLLSKILLVV